MSYEGEYSHTLYSIEHEQRIIRNRQQSSDLEVERAGTGDNDRSRGDSFAAVTVSLGNYPTTAKAVYGVQRIDVGGAEAEGQAYTTTNVGKPEFAGNIGTAVPPVGTQVRVDPVGGRNVFLYNG